VEAPEERHLREALDCYARKFGIQEAVSRVCEYFHLPVPAALLTAIRDAVRHRRMAELLFTDPDLVYRRVKLGDRHLLSAAARLAIKENALPSELDPHTGEPDPEVVLRTVKNFPYFSFDDPKRGFDKGLLF
jgi:hypothetical protein